MNSDKRRSNRQSVLDRPDYVANDPRIQQYLKQAAMVTEQKFKLLQELAENTRALEALVELPKPKIGQKICMRGEEVTGVRTIRSFEPSSPLGENGKPRNYWIKVDGSDANYNWEYTLEKEQEARDFLRRYGGLS